MKYRVWFVKYTSVVVEADDEDEAIVFADDALDDLCTRNNEYSDDYELDEVEEI